MAEVIIPDRGSDEEEKSCLRCEGKGWTPYTAELLDGTTEEAFELCSCARGAVAERSAIVVGSFTDPNKSYEVVPETAQCDCPAMTYGAKKTDPRGHKHIVLAEALRALRSRRTGSTEHDEEALTDYARRIFAPIRSGETPAEAYELFLAVRGYRYKTGALAEAARRRHLKVLAMAGSRAA